MHNPVALYQSARQSQNQRHRHISRVAGQNAGRVANNNAAFMGRININIIRAIAEIGDQLQARSGLLYQLAVNAVRDGGHEHIIVRHQGRKPGRVERPVLLRIGDVK